MRNDRARRRAAALLATALAVTAALLLTGCEDDDDRAPAPSLSGTAEPGGGPSTTGTPAPKP
ncbi:hypothetical protein [Streptomyces sp. NPDC004284]|uniref:hypothetical protein n=1 Tax=Streptomyces sp. NPDC004284 TaxID=3364695 RepID=UPI003678C428